MTATQVSLLNKPAFWLFVIFLAGSVLVVGAEQLSYVAAFPAAWLLSLALLGVVAIPAGLIIYRIDRYEPEPASLIAVAVIWGGLVALTFSAISNSYFLGFLQNHMNPETFDAWGAAIVAPLNEEFFKGAGLIAIYLMARHEINSLMDGLVYGAMIGLGFQTIENVQYFLHAAARAGGDQVSAVVGTYFVRVVIAGLYSHTLFTGLVGFGFAYLVTRRESSKRKRWMVMAVCALLAWAAHFVWNSPLLDSLRSEGSGAFVLSLVIKGLPFLCFLLILVLIANRNERGGFAHLMETEVGTDVLSEEELRILKSGTRRRAALRAMKQARGPAARDLLKRLQREQMNLAVFHQRVESHDHPAMEVQRNKIRALRIQLLGQTTSPGASSVV